MRVTALVGCVAAVVACLVGATPAAASTCDGSQLRVDLTGRPARTVAVFDRAAGETPENLALDRDGTAYVSLAFAATVARIGPTGARATVTLPAGGGLVAGIAIDPFRNVLLVAVRSGDPAAAGIWRLPRAAFDGKAAPSRLAALPTDAFPNGLAVSGRGDVFAADSDLGLVWRIPRGGTTASVWSDGALLDPDGSVIPGSTFPFPGANGLKVTPYGVLVSNTAKRTLLRIPVRRDGGAGAIAVACRNLRLDDFAVSRDGVYGATNVDQSVVRIDRAGRVSVVARVPRDPFDGPSAVAFDPRRPGRLLVTNSAFFSSPATPSLSALDVSGG